MNYSLLKTGIFFLICASFSFFAEVKAGEEGITDSEGIEINVEEIYAEIWDELDLLLPTHENDDFEEDDFEIDPAIEVRRNGNCNRNHNNGNNNNNNRQACGTSLKTLEKQFGGFILFETLIIPSLNDRRTRLSNINQLANRFIEQFTKAIQRYNPALSTHNFRRAACNLTHTTANALQRGTLNQRNVRRELNRNFNVLTRFWQDFIFPNFPAKKINADFDRAITLIARIQAGNPNQQPIATQFQLFSTLLASIVDIIDHTKG